MAPSPKCLECKRRVAKVKGKCRRCYDRLYHQEQRRKAGILPKDPVGPASGGVKIEFWTSKEQAHLIRRAAGGNVSGWLRDAAEQRLQHAGAGP